MRSTLNTPPTVHTTRGLMGVAALAMTLALSACGGGMTPEEVAQGGGEEAAEFSGEYTGPEVELAYWNGFTGGDGPFMTDLVDTFNSEHDNITVTQNTIQWGDFYQRLPAAVNAGEGPEVGVMHLDQLATNAARGVIVPVDFLAESLGLTEDDFTEEVWGAGIYKAEWAGSGMIPGRLSVRDSGVLDDLPNGVIVEQIDSMRFLPPVPGLGGAQTEALEPALSQAILGGAEPAAALQQAAQQATELMETNLESFGG